MTIPVEDLARAAVGALEGLGRLATEDRAENERAAVAAMRGVLPDLASDYRAALAQRDRADRAKRDAEDDDGG